MPIPRVYQPMPLAIDQTITLDKASSHHLTRVLRLRQGEEISVFNGEGGEFYAILLDSNPKKAIIKLVKFSDNDLRSPVTIELAQMISRPHHMDFSVQKAVELGVTKIIPIISERSQAIQQLDKRMRHWQKIIISSCEQCGRCELPELTTPQQLTDYLANTKMQLKLICIPTMAEEDLDLSTKKNVTNISVVIGSEGGMSNNEIQQAKAYNFLPWQLGPRVLRTETATVTALSLLQYLWGDL